MFFRSIIKFTTIAQASTRLVHLATSAISTFHFSAQPPIIKCARYLSFTTMNPNEKPHKDRIHIIGKQRLIHVKPIQAEGQQPTIRLRTIDLNKYHPVRSSGVVMTMSAAKIMVRHLTELGRWRRKEFPRYMQCHWTDSNHILMKRIKEPEPDNIWEAKFVDDKGELYTLQLKGYKPGIVKKTRMMIVSKYNTDDLKKREIAHMSFHFEFAEKILGRLVEIIQQFEPEWKLPDLAETEEQKLRREKRAAQVEEWRKERRLRHKKTRDYLKSMLYRSNLMQKIKEDSVKKSKDEELMASLQMLKENNSRHRARSRRYRVEDD